MRNSEPPIYYLVGTPKSRLSKLEAELIGRPWEQVRPGLDVKLLDHEGELYVQAQSRDRVSKERAMRKRRLRKLWHRLCESRKKLNTKGCAQIDARRTGVLLTGQSIGQMTPLVSDIMSNSRAQAEALISKSNSYAYTKCNPITHTDSSRGSRLGRQKSWLVSASWLTHCVTVARLRGFEGYG